MQPKRMQLGRWLFALIALSPGSAVAAETLNLDDAVRFSLSHNERALKAPLRVEAAEGGVARARSAFFPSLVLGGQYSITSRGSDLTGTLTLSQPILNPSAFPLYSQAKHNLAAESFGADQDLRILAYDTARAFFQTLATQRVVQASQRRLETAKNNLAYAEARVGAQLASSNDVTRAQVALAAASSAVVSTEANVDRAFLNLSFLIGKPVTGGLVIPERVTKAALTFDPKEGDIKTALDRRFDVKSLHERAEGLRDFAKEPLYRLAPTVTAAGIIRFDPDPQQPGGKAVDQQLGINLTWNIFDAGFRYADRKTRLAQADSAFLDEKLLRRSVETEVKLALVNLKAARKTFVIAEEAVIAAQRNVDETEVLYRQGLAKAIELTEANLARFHAEVTRESARVQMHFAYLDVRQALGYGPLDE